MMRLRFRVLWVIAAFLVLTGGSVCVADGQPDPEHTIWVKLETIPNGAEIYAIPEEGEPLTAKIGTTPCIVAIDLNWRSVFWVKKWRSMVVWSPGNICYSTLNENDDYDIHLKFLARKDGYEPTRVDKRILSIKHPGDGWKFKDLWPTQTTLSIPLYKAADRTSDRHASPHGRPGARKVILADSTSQDGMGLSGTLTVTADIPDAQVFVDKRYVGNTPVQVILQDGRHVIQVQKSGYYPVRKDVIVTDDAEVAYRAELPPLVE